MNTPAPVKPIAVSLQDFPRVLGFPVSRASLATLQARHGFPRALQIGSRCVWLLEDLERWLVARKAASEADAARRSAAALKGRVWRDDPAKVAAAHAKGRETRRKNRLAKEALQSNLSSLFVDTSERSE